MSRPFCPRTFGRLCWQMIAIIVVLFALSVSLFRGLLPKLDQVRQELVSYIYQQYQVKVEVSELTAEWQAFGPAVTIKHLVLPVQENLPVTFIIDNVHLKLDFWDSLVSASPQIENVIFEGVKIALDLDRVGQGGKGEQSSDAPVVEQNTDWLYALMLEQFDRFAITDVTMQLISRSHKFRPIHIRDLRWRNLAGRHRAEGALFLDERASEVERLSLAVDIRGDGHSPESLTGQLYLAANSLDLGEWASRQENPYASGKKLPLEGVVNLQAWAEFSNRAFTAATVAFEPSWLQWELKGEQQKFEIQGGQFNWQPQVSGWQLTSSDLAFVTNGQAWPVLHIGARKRDDQLMANINQLDAKVLLPLLPLVPGMDLDGLHLWQTMDPSGTIEQLKLGYGEQQGFALSAQLTQFAWQASGSIPGAEAIDLMLGIQGSDLYLSAPEQHYRLDFDGGFEAPLSLDGDAFTLKYAMGEAALVAPKLHFYNADLDLDAAMKFGFSGEASLNLLADVQVKNAARAKYYFPKHGMSESLVDYLSGAIKAGQSQDAKVVWNGALKHFPYDDNSGVFQAGFSLNQARYQFQPDWPEVTELSLDALFENAAMDIWVNKGMLMDVPADGAHVAIPRMSHETLLTVKADLRTQGEAAKQVLLRSPLADTVGATLEVVQVQGDVSGKLDLSIPLYHGGKAQILGQVSFDDTPVYVTQPGVQLEGVTGVVHFANDVVTGEEIQARLFEQPVSFSFDTGKSNKNYGLNLDMQGKWALASLPPSLDNPLKDYYSGELDWQGAMTLIFDELGYRIQAQVKSDMQGVELSLPGKFAKTADSQRALSFELIGDNKQASLGAKLGDQMEFWGGFDEQSGDHLAHFDLLLGRLFKPGDQLKRQAGHLQLDMPATEFAPWLPIIKGFMGDAALESSLDAAMRQALEEQTQETPLLQAEEAPQKSHFFPLLIAVDGQVRQLNLYGQPLTELSLEAYPTEHGWRFEGNANEFSGRVDFYPDWSTQGLKLVASRFNFAPERTQGDESELASDEVLSILPPLAVDVDQFSVHGKSLGHLVLQATPKNGDYQIQTIAITTPGITLKGKGAWSNSEGQNLTEFEVDLKAKQFDEVSERLGIDPGLKEAPLDLQAELSWQGAPHAFSLETLNGQISYKLGKGHLSEVSDKGARIFSLFSLDSLLRKLSLDFSDVFGKGLYFNAFTGTLKLDNGVVKTTDSEMDAVAGNMKVRGYTDLTTESLNYDIRFVPQLASSVPTVVLLSTGGWTLGLGAFALTKVLEPVIEVISEIRFRLTGTMSEPKLEELERKSKEIEIPESVLPRQPEQQPGAETKPQSESKEPKQKKAQEPKQQLQQEQNQVQQPAAPQETAAQPEAVSADEQVMPSGVTIPKSAVEAMPEFKETPTGLQPVEQQPQAPQQQESQEKPVNKEPSDAGQPITMSEWSRRRGEPQVYSRAA
ncbi:YhdP family protein [Shewanella sp. cp20]|uniref:YhdP family protein n=1 Tax=Shewanella sp. cp20 TaxID=1521167 RepID=UPI0005A175AE|nr:YhdP family protein [Shewanella sp. cp20]KIO35817.1 ribonuclease G [Shewanella sp. cp20]